MINLHESVKYARAVGALVFLASATLGSTLLSQDAQYPQVIPPEQRRRHLSTGAVRIVDQLDGKTRVSVIDLFRSEMNSFYGFKTGGHPIPERIGLKREQIDEVCNRFNLFAEANMAYLVEIGEKQTDAMLRGDMEEARRLHDLGMKVQEERRWFCYDFGHTLAEILTPSQVEKLKGMAYTVAFEKIGNLDRIFYQSMKDHDIDTAELLSSEQFQKKVMAIKKRHHERLLELNRQTMEEFMELLPAESRKAMEFTLGVDTLTHTRPTSTETK